MRENIKALCLYSQQAILLNKYGMTTAILLLCLDFQFYLLIILLNSDFGERDYEMD